MKASLATVTGRGASHPGVTVSPETRCFVEGV